MAYVRKLELFWIGLLKKRELASSRGSLKDLVLRVPSKASGLGFLQGVWV